MTELSEDQIAALLVVKQRAGRLRSLRQVVARGDQARAFLAAAATADGGSSLPTATPASSLSASDYAWGNGWPIAAPDLRPLRAGPRGPGAAVGDLRWGKLQDRALLLVEVAALAALVYVVVGSFSGLDALNQEVAEARRIAPVATAPVDELLPGSSSPPAAGGEVPAALRSVVRGGAPIPIAPPGPQMATRLSIPSIGVDSVIVEGDAWEDLKKGIGHHLGTANPGERGNAVYAGHNDVYGEVFRRLEELKAGDRITVYAAAHVYRYEVKRLRIVGPKEVSVMAPTPDATLTLITCYPYRVDTQRVVVTAVLVE